MRYTREHLQECFGRRLMSSVRLHLEEARVTAPEVRQDGGLITALVEFPGMGPCRVYIRIGGDAEEIPEIAGECSCCRRGDCVHVAMVLLRALRDEEGWRGEAPGTGGRERPSQGADRDRHPDATSHQILYLLRPERPLGDMLEVSVITARRLPNGGYDGVRDYRPAWASRGRPPRFLQHGDIALLGALSRLPSDPAGRIRLRGAIGEQLLPDMLETGRCCLHQPEKALRTGATRKGTLAWWIDRQGVQFPRFGSLPPAGRILRLQSLWYIDIERGECGRLESGLPAELVNRLLELTGGLMPEAVQAFNRMVCERFPDVVPPLPRSLSVVSREGVVPTPCLYFTRHGREGSAQDGSRDLALLSFDYGGLVFESGHVSRYFDGERVWQVARDTEREAACVERLRALGLKPVPREWRLDDGQWGFYLPTGSYGWADLQLTSLPRLQASGWRIGFDPGFGHRLATVEAWQGQLDPLEKQDWFGVSLGVRVDGEYINLLPALVNLLRDGAQGIHVADEDSRPLLVPLGDGRKVAVPRFRLQHILDTLLELTQGDPLDEAGRLPMRRSQLARVAELAGEGDRAPIAWEGAEVLQTLAGRLRRIDRLEPVAPPAGLQARLRDYQALGVAWLQFLRACRLGGVLADDMGLGKTLQALAHLLLEQEQGRMDRPSLVLAPTSLMTNWRREAARFAPGLRVLLLHGPGRHARFREIPRHDLVITSYPLLVRDREQLCQQGYHLLILDEAQTIKNPKTRVSRAVRELDARHRLCLTGTPMENHLGEVWSLFDFLLPGLLGSEWQFQRLIRAPIEKQGDEAAARRLAERLQPFMLRRTKQAVARELPPRTEIVRGVELEGDQRELYEGVRLAMHRQVREAIAESGLERSHILVLDALLKLRQICCDPRLVKLTEAKRVTRSAKLDLLMEMLPEMIEEGRRVLLFSQFTGMLALIEAAVREIGIDHVKLTGSTRDRAAVVDRFQRGEVPLFLISLKAGGAGLNLTAADTVIHYDPWWNPAVERQASDRAHRIGQKNPVFVYKLIGEGTVEEKIQALQARKQALANSLFIPGGGALAGLTDAELDNLFGPLE